MTPEDKAFIKSATEDYLCDEYKAGIDRYLLLSCHYSAKDAKELMEIEACKKLVDESFAKEESVADKFFRETRGRQETADFVSIEEDLVKPVL